MRTFHFEVTAFLSICLLFVGLTIAKPLDKRAVAISSIAKGDHTSTATHVSSSAARSSAASITTSSDHTTTPSDGAARVAGAPSSTSPPLATFCDAFVKKCYEIALHGQFGEVTVSHSCQRNGRTSFTYSCTKNGEFFTAKVLKALGRAFHAPSYTTIESIRVVTEVEEDISTTYDLTTRTTTSTRATTTTALVEKIEVDLMTMPSTTVVSTSIIPYTTSSTASATLTEQTTFFTTATKTQTEVLVVTDIIPNYQPPAQEEGLNRRAPSTFCLAYRIGCQNECNRVSSRVDVEICEGTQWTSRYTLSCICKNGKTETQHVLEAIAEDRKIISVTILGTSTTHITSSRTTTIPRAIATTKFVTDVSTIDSTLTSTETSTTTVGTSTRYTSVSSAVTTAVTTNYLTTTTSSTATTVQVTTTTRIVVAPTGYIHAFDAITGYVIGTLGLSRGLSLPLALVYPSSFTEYHTDWMLVKDLISGVYQLMVSGDPMKVLMQFKGDADGVFEGGTVDYALLEVRSYDACGANGIRSGPVYDGVDCQTFIISPVALDPSPGSTPNTISLPPIWINPLGHAPANWTGSWAYGPRYRELYNIADPDFYNRVYPDLTTNYMTLRFSFAS